LIIAIPFPEATDPVASQPEIALDFVYRFLEGERIVSNAQREDHVASLRLKQILKKTINHQTIVFYEGIEGKHRFISKFHQFINDQREKLRKDVPGNVSLPGNLHHQVRIAYSVPRTIALITVAEGELMNMFPTDLHGPCGDGFYTSSLRHGGKASQQLDKTGRLVLSLMPVEEYKTVYSLGKNHMQDMTEFMHFAIMPTKSPVLKLPVPASALAYKELECVDSFDAGIHRIYSYRIVGTKELRTGNTLAHTHQYYAQWRIDRKLPLEMHLR
jgi:flavin reductase (DIM6/NTAB) family NADH-FMN oxidoreductase RutF